MSAFEQTLPLECCLHLVAFAAVHLQQYGMIVAGPSVFTQTSSGGQQTIPIRCSSTQSSTLHMHGTPVSQLTVLMMHSHALGTLRLQKRLHQQPAQVGHNFQ